MTLLRVAGLSKRFGGNLAVDDLAFEVAAGEAVALIGPNGAGKSTALNLINGQLRPERGSVRLGDRELVGLPPREIWRLGVGRTFQVAQTFGSLTVLENVQLALLSADRQLHSIWRRAGNYRRDAAFALLDGVGIAVHAARRCGDLAYGDVKRVELAIALANRPRLLLMDEPTAGMAPAERGELMRLAKRLAVDQRLALLFIEHSVDVVFTFADRVLVLVRGRLLAAGRPDEIRADPRVAEAYFGVPSALGVR